MRFGGHCKRYRIFCNAYRKICRPYSGEGHAFSVLRAAMPLLFARPAAFTFLAGKFTLLAGCAIFHTARHQASEALQKAPGAASVGAIYAAVNAMNQLGRVHTTVAPSIASHNAIAAQRRHYFQNIAVRKTDSMFYTKGDFIATSLLAAMRMAEGHPSTSAGGRACSPGQANEVRDTLGRAARAIHAL